MNRFSRQNTQRARASPSGPTDTIIQFRDFCPSQSIHPPRDKFTLLFEFKETCAESDCAIWVEHIVCPWLIQQFIQPLSAQVMVESITVYRARGHITVKARLFAPPQTLALFILPRLRDRDILDLGAVEVEPGSRETIHVRTRVLEATKAHPAAFQIQGVPADIHDLGAVKPFLLTAYKLPHDPILAYCRLGTTLQLLVHLVAGAEPLQEQVEFQYVRSWAYHALQACRHTLSAD